jgi:antitoxin ParD1/3/4
MATVVFPPDLEQFVQQELAAGKYQSEGDVVAAGLQLLRERERRLQELRAEILPALEQLERGEKAPLDVEAIEAGGRRLLSMGPSD